MQLNATRAVTAGAVVLALALGHIAPAVAQPAHQDVRRGLDALTKDAQFPGALIQVDNGQWYALRSGTAELGTGRPMVGAEGRFRIASHTKTFVAVVALQLVAEGRVQLDAPIERYLPGLVRGTGEGAGIHGADITVRQLLQHTSGLWEYTDHFGYSRSHPRLEMINAALAHKATHKPGAEWRYSNTGYLLLTEMLERLTGRPAADELAQRIFQPLRLNATYWPGPGKNPPRGPHAHSYGTDPANLASGRVDLTDIDLSVADGAGVLVSSPGDLAEFWRALQQGRLLPPHALAEMRRTIPIPNGAGFPDEAEYGLGTVRYPLSCGGWYWGHGGDYEGGSSRGGLTEDGRSAVLYLTSGHRTLSTLDSMLKVVDTALCEGR